MTEAGFFAPQKVNRTGMVVVLAMHAAAITALALSKMEVPIKEHYGPIDLIQVWEPKEPPPNQKQPEAKPLPKQQVRPTTPDPIVNPPIDRGAQIETTPTGPVVSQGDPVVPFIEPPIVEISPPVKIAALVRPGTEMQPPYPPSAIRLGEEGKVTVRVLIGTDGRVKAIEKVSATSDAFWRATERHALRNWRFRAATEDGRPVESWREMTVRFELTASV